MNPGARFRPELGIFAYDNPKNQQLCPLEKCPAATNGANPGKFTQPKNRPNAKAAQFTHPVTGKNPRKAKRNRELSVLPIFPYLCRVFLPIVSPTRYLNAMPGFGRALFCFIHIQKYNLSQTFYGLCNNGLWKFVKFRFSLMLPQ